MEKRGRERWGIGIEEGGKTKMMQRYLMLLQFALVRCSMDGGSSQLFQSTSIRLAVKNSLPKFNVGFIAIS